MAYRGSAVVCAAWRVGLVLALLAGGGGPGRTGSTVAHGAAQTHDAGQEVYDETSGRFDKPLHARICARTAGPRTSASYVGVSVGACCVCLHARMRKYFVARTHSKLMHCRHLSRNSLTKRIDTHPAFSELYAQKLLAVSARATGKWVVDPLAQTLAEAAEATDVVKSPQVSAPIVH